MSAPSGADLFAAARRALADNRTSEAIALFEQAAAGSQDDACRYAALLGLTRALGDLGRDGEAERACHAAIRLLPDRTTGHAMLALLLERAGRSEAALASGERAVERAPGKPAIHNLAASLALALRRDARALAHSDAALVLDPHDQRALADRWLALWRLGRTEQARRLLDPDRDVVIDTRGADLAGDIADAILRAPGLREADPDSPLIEGRRLPDIAALPPALVADLSQWLRDTAARYPIPDSTHPLHTGRPSSHRMYGWASVMAAGAHERAHIHEGGWLSAVFYAAMPTDPDGGAILLGGHLRDTDGVAPIRRLRPERGMLILFPSFLHHRTEPFHGAGQRISVAIDLLRDGASRH